MRENTRSTRNLTEGSPLRLIIFFAVPMIMGNLFQQLYNFVDTMIVGHYLGVDALAGVGATTCINFLIIGFCMGICGGFAIPVAQRFGAKDEKMLHQYVANAIYLSASFSVVLTIIVSIFCKNILIWLKTPDNIIEYSYVYILTIFIGIPVTFLYNIFAGFIRSIGDSKTPLIFLIISTFINIFLDYFFIAVLSLGVFGAALATVLSQLISGILCIIVIIRKFPVLHVHGDEWKINRHCIYVLLKMGLPMGLQYSITAIGSVILQTSVNVLGSLSVAAVTTAGKVNMLFMCITDALGATMATYGGQNLGAGKIDRIRLGTKTAGFIGIAYSLIAFLAANIVKMPLINLFVDTPNPEMLRMASQHVTITMVALPMLVFVNELRFLIQGLGFSAFATFAGVFEMIARTIAGIIFVPKFGFLGACIASPFAWLLADLFLFPAYFYVINKLENMMKTSQTP